MSKAKFEVIPKLRLFEPTCDGQGNETITTECNTGKGGLRYFIQPDDDFVDDEYNHFPFVLEADGSLWVHANLFLLEQLRSVKHVPSKTLESKAVDLVMFRRWLDNEDVSYLEFNKKIMARPTYRFCAHLHDQIRESQMTVNTARRRMGTVQMFYRWLKNVHGVEFENPLWREKEVFISFKDDRGYAQSKKQVSTDLAFKQTKHRHDYSESILDGGSLRPLSQEEQYAVIDALMKIGNTEMTLSFLIALTTGARLQTVFTLRRHHFQNSVTGTVNEIRINTGYGTSIDTKNSKNTVLHIPIWLYQRVQIYTKSKRATKRHELSPHVYESEGDQYIFLTRTGKPYYMANADPFITLYRHPPRGISVNAFIRQQLIPKLNASGHNFTIRFHDLRATFGMNLLEEAISTVKDARGGAEIKFTSDNLWTALMTVQRRMGHNSITTTERYLNYRKHFSVALSVQSEFEMHLMNVAEAS